MEWGQNDRAAFLADLVAAGQLAQLPASAIEPELWPENLPWIAAFVALCPSRPVSLAGAGAIPLTEVAAYAALMGIADTETLTRRIRACDAVWLAWQRQQADRK